MVRRGSGFVLSLGFLAQACIDLGCSDRVCESPDIPPAQLVDEQGAAVANTRGLLVTGLRQQRFDCARDIQCRNGNQLQLDGLLRREDADQAQVYFQRDGGTLGPAQDVKVTSEKKTDPDFGGPGCSCSWTVSETEPLVVPDDARAPTGQVEEIGGASGLDG